jgi:hypothetical protein
MESKNKPVEHQDKKLFRMWNVKFRMCFTIYYPHSQQKQQIQMDFVISAQEPQKTVKYLLKKLSPDVIATAHPTI